MTEESDFGAFEAAEGDKNDEIENLKTKIKEFEERELKYKEEKELQEKEFGSKRAKFKEIFLQKEEEYKTERDAHLETQKKADILAKELNDVRTELEDIKAAVSFSESNKEDAILEIRRQCNQEVDTLQGLLKEVAEEASTSTAAQYENERTKLQELNEKYEDEVRDLRSKLSQEREGFLTSVAKQLKQIAPGSLGQQSSNLSMEEENLEASMKKAQADAEILKSVVLPLEEEIKGLKFKLATYERNPDDIGTPPMKHATPETQSLSDLDAKDPEDRIQELLHYLRVEKSSRKDLEMYVAVLTTQKNIFEEECDKTKKDLEEVCRILNEEKREHEQLQQTWQMANDQFLESQTLMMMDLRRMESVLSAEQQRQIAEALKKAEEASEKFKNADAKMQEKLKQQSQKDLVRANSPNITADLNNETDDDKSILDASDLPEGDSFLDSRVLDSNEELDGLRIQISPEKVLNLPYLSQAQTKALTDPTPELQLRQSLIASAKSKVDRISVDGKRLVGQKEWDLLQQQLKESRDKLGKPCDMCNNYEDQLQNIQDDLKKEQVRAKSFERNLNSEILTTESQQKYIAELEDTLKKTVSEADEQVSSLLNKLQDCEKYIEELKQQFTQSQVDLRDQLQVLTGSREEVQNELTRLQKENDTLIGKHSKYAQQLQNEDINLPNNIEEMQLLLLKYREEIIQCKVAKEHTEETLKSEIMFLKDQIHAEQQEKNNIEESLSQELATVQEKLVVQESLKSELERESSVRADLSKKLTESETTLKSIQAKSKQLIKALQQQVAEQSEIRSKLESDVQKYRSKVQSLQIDLDNSEAVQRDFVKLSQSLQIQLEKIRQAETEVRWQQEDDIDDCNNCKQQFSVTKRKHHCRHCGRIFCSDCVTKTVNSGPNSRPSKVCDICHTILVRDALPYFSTEPPSTPS
ncbi:rab GTPase-binding effector protein 1-like isoform X2 [Mytilus trossulus]|uniref:rab GTPase-binding effector protein 1-like isoform X2 n=1 Tax=Mytilus trossulus TaxID=6551 RepID=UPI003007623A